MSVYELSFSKQTKEEYAIDYHLAIPNFLKIHDKPFLENGFIVSRNVSINGEKLGEGALFVPVGAYNPIQNRRLSDHKTIVTEESSTMLLKEADNVIVVPCLENTRLHEAFDPKFWLPKYFKIGFYK